ncbi:MAG TPA: type II toxin-antitoxin system RelE/ParE family toxin [Terracidiphilus sp.]|nr:type II toxin-antitoxin system RelE/ParE family toxin [Terracidiphilus sp.]
MKGIEFLGDSLKAIGEFPREARQAAGYQLRRVQDGIPPEDFKPMPDIGKGVEEIRVWVSSGTYRVIYTARLANSVYVLHAFQKKTRETSEKDKAIARKRFKQLMRGSL